MFTRNIYERLIWLKELRDQNLQESTFEEKTGLVARLGIKILPSEDLKSRKILCRLNLAKINNPEREQPGFTKVTFGGPLWTRTTDPPDVIGML
jgi:hypothetical protein